jgi:prepilin-type N-terminal cleavage/methylation domain-containing protein
MRKHEGFTILELIVVIVILGILALIAVPNFMESCGHRSPVSTAKADQRSLATALESYYIDHKSYPAWSASPDLGINASSRRWAALNPPVPTFLARSASHPELITITTPVSYLTSYFVDPMAPMKNVTFGYYSINALNEGDPAGWFTWSPGPDADYDITMKNIEAIYDPAQQVPNPALVDLTYDPTNGTKSSGDVWRAKQ